MWWNFDCVELNLGNATVMGENIALYGVWIQVNTGVEKGAICKPVYMDKGEAVK